MRLLDRLLGLGPSDEPRPIAVGTRSVVTERPVVSVPGARVRIERSGRDGEVIRFLAWCHREQVDIEIVDADIDRVTVDGRALSPAEAARALKRRSG
ncbi:MAG: hypothetical protein FJ102_13995 [Deltaproteobacteria bacterium]|nr:hypothetical protein [Deltaproteobacteria bacterium]